MTETEKEIPRWLPPAPHKERARALHNAAALAYLGDSVYEVPKLLPSLLCGEKCDFLSACVRGTLSSFSANRAMFASSWLPRSVKKKVSHRLSAFLCSSSSLLDGIS